MASLKSLTLTSLTEIQADPVMDRRNRTIAHSVVTARAVWLSPTMKVKLP